MKTQFSLCPLEARCCENGVCARERVLCYSVCNDILLHVCNGSCVNDTGRIHNNRSRFPVGVSSLKPKTATATEGVLAIPAACKDLGRSVVSTDVRYVTHRACVLCKGSTRRRFVRSLERFLVSVWFYIKIM
jgi:hypothetical protein